MHKTVLIIEKFIKEQKLLSQSDKIVVGTSGGADSIALLDILHKLNYECIVAHCNFHLRGQESYRDEYFVEKVAGKYNMKYLVANFDTKKYIEEESISLEMAARELRYAWFEKIRIESNAQKIAVAHQQDDSVETILINLIRGTGIKGLTGITPINGNIVRPLLAINRDEIMTYLSDNNLDFIEDSTNKQDIYTRNKIRLNIIPLLKTINPSVSESIIRTSQNLVQVEKIYNNHIDRVKKKIFKENQINIELLLKEEEPQTILFELLYPYGFNAVTINNIYDSIKAQSGKTFYSQQYKIIKDRKTFIIKDISNSKDVIYTLDEHQKQINKPIKLSFEYIKNIKKINFSTDKNVIYVDKSKLDYPLTIRKWIHGDKFIPFGMKGQKKISDYFSNQKKSIIDKENTYLLCTASNKIIWIIGERMDDRFKITEMTNNCLKICFEE